MKRKCFQKNEDEEIYNEFYDDDELQNYNIENSKYKKIQ